MSPREPLPHAPGGSIRDIAERLGFTKAALYYHFKSNADILLELHLRLHTLGERLPGALEALPDGAVRARAWPQLLDEFIGDIDDNRELVLMHQRNQNALEALQHSERHHPANDDIEAQIRRLLPIRSCRRRPRPSDGRVQM